MFRPRLLFLRITDDALRTELVPVSVVFPQRRSTSLSVVGAGVERLFGDSVVSLTCAVVRLRNSAVVEAVFPLIYLGRNVEFSAPLSQFPLRIPPGGEALLRVCYAPTAEGVQRDTLMLMQNCTFFSVPLVARGAADVFSGVSRCAVPMRLRQILPVSGETVLVADAPFPQPSGDMIHIPVQLLTATPALHKLSAALYNGLGALVGSYDIAWETITQSNNAAYASAGVIRFSAAHLPPGCYRMVVRSADGAVASVAVVVVH